MSERDEIPAELIGEADAFRDTMIDRADGMANGVYPWWHGWAIFDAYVAGVMAERKRRQEETATLKATLRAFTFPAHPDQFQSTDDGMTEALVCDSDVQRARELTRP